MNILYIFSSNAIGGAVHSALSIVKGLLNHNNKVIAIVPRSLDGPLYQILDSMGVVIYYEHILFKSYPNYSGIKSFMLWPKNFVRMLILNYISKKEIIEIIRKENIDIVHTNVGPIQAGYEAAKITGIPHVWHIREYGDIDFNIHEYPSLSVFRSRLRDSYTISITKDILKYNNLEGYSKAKIIYNGVRSKQEAQYCAEKGNYFLCASRLSREKGFDQTIRVFYQFIQIHQDYKLVILGNGPAWYEQHLKDYCRRLGIEDSVIFEGYRDDVSNYMLHARALLVASPAEGFGRMSAEAAFAGCLLIGKNTAGTKEIMDIMGGYRFLDDNEMLTCMNEVIALSSYEYEGKALSAQLAAVNAFSEEQYIDNVLSFYKDILGR